MIRLFRGFFQLLGRLSRSRLFTFLFATLAVFAPAFFYAGQPGYFWLNIAWSGIVTLMVFFVLNAVFMLLFAVLMHKIQIPIWLKWVYFLGIFATIGYFIFGVAAFAIGAGKEAFIWPALLFAASVLFVVYALFIHPTVKRAYRGMISVVLCLAILTTGCFTVFDVRAFALDTEPVVFDIGEDYYSVVFASNKKSIGFIEYDYNGETQKVVAAENGKPTVGKIHAVQIKKEHLQNNTYRIGATRVLSEVAYGGQLGKTVTGTNYAFQGTPKNEDDVTVYAFSDWHNRLDLLQNTVPHLQAAGSADLVLMLGDAADHITSDKDIIAYIIRAGTILTGSTVPAVYARGNHETRNAGGHYLAAKLGMPALYFRTSFGENFTFTVFDCGEDKSDSHREYGGIAAYEPYMQAQLAWAATLPSAITPYHIALCHTPNFGIRETDADGNRFHPLNEQWFTELQRMGAQMAIGGHLHSYKLEENAVLQLVDGGLQSGKDGYRYIACLLRFHNGEVTVKAYNENGTKLDEQNKPLS